MLIREKKVENYSKYPHPLKLHNGHTKRLIIISIYQIIKENFKNTAFAHKYLPSKIHSIIHSEL